MADLFPTQEFASFDFQADNLAIDLSPILSEIIRKEQTLLSLISTGTPATETKHEWLEDRLYPNVVNLNDAIDNDDTSATLYTNHGARIIVGAILKDTKAGKSELMQVTDITSDTITISRGYGSTSGEAHDKDAELRIVSYPAQEGSTPRKNFYMPRTREYNYTQIFERSVSMTGTAQAIKQWVVSDQFQNEISKRMIEIKNELNDAIINSRISANQGDDNTIRTMKGLLQFASAGNIKTSAGELTEDLLDELADMIEDDCGSAVTPKVIVAHPTLIESIGLLDQGQKIQIMRSEESKTIGRYVTNYLFNKGFMCTLVRERLFPKDTILLGDLSFVKLVPLNGRALFGALRPQIGDSKTFQMIGEYTLEVRNAKEAFAIATGVTPYTP